MLHSAGLRQLSLAQLNGAFRGSMFKRLLNGRSFSSCTSAAAIFHRSSKLNSGTNGSILKLKVSSSLACRAYSTKGTPSPTPLNLPVAEPVNQPTFTQEEREAAKAARLAGLGWIGNLPEKWIPYLELLRVEKPVGTLLLLIPSIWGITMAAYGIAAPFSTWLYATTLFTVGAFFMRGAGCTINDILDRNMDNKVGRTIERPVASGRVSIPQAITWLGAQCFVGLGVLVALPSECFLLGAASLPIVATYPLFKRVTYFPQAVLLVAFSWGCLLGFPAVNAPLVLGVAVPLFISNFLWCMTYDTIYAHQDKVFDVKAGVKSSALAWAEKTKPILNKMTHALLACYLFAGFWNSMGPGFYLSTFWGFSRIYEMIKTVDLDNPKSCWLAFVANIRTGEIMLAGMVVDYLLKILGFL